MATLTRDFERLEDRGSEEKHVKKIRAFSLLLKWGRVLVINMVVDNNE